MNIVDRLLEADDFDAREYFTSTGSSTDEVAQELKTRFFMHENPRSKKEQREMPGVRSFVGGGPAWRGRLHLTRTYVGDERNQTWAVDFYPFNENRQEHYHTSGPQHALTRFLALLYQCFQSGWMTNRQAMLQAARDSGFDTTHLAGPVGESFDPSEYLSTTPKDEEDVLRSRGYAKDEENRGYWHCFWPINDEFYVGASFQVTIAGLEGWAAVGDYAETGALYLGFYDFPFEKADEMLGQLEAAVQPFMQFLQAEGLHPWGEVEGDEGQGYRNRDIIRKKWWSMTPPSRKFTESLEAGDDFSARDYFLGGMDPEQVAHVYDMDRTIHENYTTYHRALPVQPVVPRMEFGKPGDPDYDIRPPDVTVEVVNCYFSWFPKQGRLDFLLRGMEMNQKAYVVTSEYDLNESDAGALMLKLLMQTWKLVGSNQISDYMEFRKHINGAFKGNTMVESFDAREYYLEFPSFACAKCDADLQAPRSIVRHITFTDGKVASVLGHSGPNREWEEDENYTQEFQGRTLGEIVDIENACVKCHTPIRREVAESEDFDAREYLTSDPREKSPDEVFTQFGYELQEGNVYNRYWPLQNDFQFNVGGKNIPVQKVVRTWACLTDPNGAAYFGQYDVPYVEFESWVVKADKVADEIVAAYSQPGIDYGSPQVYAGMAEIWERTFPYTPDAPVQEALEGEFDPRQYFLSPSMGDATGKELMNADIDMRRRGPGHYVTTFPGNAMMDLKRGVRKWHVTFWPGNGMGKEEADFDESEIVNFVKDLQVLLGDMPDLAAWRHYFQRRQPRRPQEPGIFDMPESEDFDARDYFTTTASVPDLLKSMRYEISPDGAAKVFKGANDRDYMLFVTQRGGQSLDTGIATSIYDLGIYVGKGRDWDCLKHIFGMTPTDMQETMEQAEKAIRRGEWTGLGLNANRVAESGEAFDSRSYFLDANATFAVLDELGFKKLPSDPKAMNGKQTWQRIQGSVRIDVEHYDDENNGTFVVGYVETAPGKWVQKEVDIPNKPRSLAQVIDDVDAVCRGVYESEEDAFNARDYFIDSSTVQFRLPGGPAAWNFGGEKLKEFPLFGGDTVQGPAVLHLEYIPDEWKPKWIIQLFVNVPWKGRFSSAPLVRSVCASERLLRKRIEAVVAKASKWWEQHRWGLALYPLIYGENGVKDYVGEHPDWSEYVEQNAGDLPSEFEKQTEESAAAWRDLIFKFRAERGFGVQESEEPFDPRDYVLQDVGPAIVDRLKALGYKQVQLRILTDRHATLTMNDPEPEYEDEENGGGIDQTKRVYARNRVKTVVRELMGLPTDVYDFSGDGGTDYLFKICDPEHCGITGTYEAEDSFDPKQYFLSLPDKETWKVCYVNVNDGVEYRTKGFPNPEKALKYVYTSSLFSKAEAVTLERTTGDDFTNYTYKDFKVTRDMQVIDPDTGRILLDYFAMTEALDPDFDARGYMLAPDPAPDADFADLLERIGFDAIGASTWQLVYGGDTKFVIQARRDGMYRYTVYDVDGHKVRGQIVARQPLIDMLQQHLNMKLRESDDFDPRKFVLQDPESMGDIVVIEWMEQNGFQKVHEAKFYTVWSKTIGQYEIKAFKGQPDDKIHSSRWWMEIWEDGKNTSPGMGVYFAANNFLPRLKRQVELHTRWTQP